MRIRRMNIPMFSHRQIDLDDIKRFLTTVHDNLFLCHKYQIPDEYNF